MGWVKLDDGFFRNPKVLHVGRDAKALYLAGLCYSGSSLTDGFIPTNATRGLAVDIQIGSPKKAIVQLVDAGLWVEVGDGFMIHDYLEFNQSAEKVHAIRDAAKDRMHRSRSQNVRANNDENSQDVRAKFSRSSQNVREPEEIRRDTDETKGLSSESQHAPEPPSEPAKPKTVTPAPKPRSSRIAEDFAVNDAMRQWANEAGYTPQFVTYETEKFRDYYASSPKTYLDWPATWRNWLRRSAESNPQAVNRNAAPSPSNVKPFQKRYETPADRTAAAFDTFFAEFDGTTPDPYADHEVIDVKVSGQ